MFGSSVRFRVQRWRSARWPLEVKLVQVKSGKKSGCDSNPSSKTSLKTTPSRKNVNPSTIQDVKMTPSQGPYTLNPETLNPGTLKHPKTSNPENLKT